MHQKDNPIYQRMIRRLRRRNIEGGYGWPGKPLNAPATTRYPNIAAEVEAYTGWLHLPAEFANASRDVMATVLEDGEKLTALELRGLCCLYGCSSGFLLAPTLQMVDPATNKGKCRLRQLFDLLAQVDKLKLSSLWRIKRTLDPLERGEPVTYSAWRRGCDEIRWELERKGSKGVRSAHIR